MAARRRPAGAGRGRMPGWALLLLGLVLGVATVLITQLVLKRHGAGDGLAGLFSSRPAEKPAKKVAEPPTAPAPKAPKFDFYTVLPETETVLSDRRRPDRTKPAKTETGVSYVLQAGSFATFADADQLKARLALTGLVAQIEKVTIDGRGEFHRVRLGPYARLQELDAADQQLRHAGVRALRLKVKKTGA